MNKDILILLQNSMAHATQIHLRNDEKVDTAEVFSTALAIAKNVWSAASDYEYGQLEADIAAKRKELTALSVEVAKLKDQVEPTRPTYRR
jgi:cell division protein FtsB